MLRRIVVVVVIDTAALLGTPALERRKEYLITLVGRGNNKEIRHLLDVMRARENVTVPVHNALAEPSGFLSR